MSGILVAIDFDVFLTDPHMIVYEIVSVNSQNVLVSK